MQTGIYRLEHGQRDQVLQRLTDLGERVLVQAARLTAANAAAASLGRAA